ncbi:hypothetical protein [Legionella oakridgensis]|uniref:Thioredoxin domain-containing protein n=2 Tax=Legionella oakridgensis TaxID=29423 RepID=W0BG28_9GAMM|nr:hypothetical protein [Legionella oakridgensis]AHE67656.1 hypothetical protein Loa_02112 [Legionella oakridgensis ATCC 33761 = DSM 21215]ETO92885.1 hypothetical protein LOR_61c15390 [Legionella oakridgensis RV-2-2007]KTD37008.1 hypothetical protein Loak_2144 [Legionella oakridgensis]STY20683.1 Uncharacterised protein [Legionella longbeachae]
MRAAVKTLLGLFLLLNASLVFTDSQSNYWFEKEKEEVQINVDLFLTSTCPHCQKANEFFRNMEKNNPWLAVHRYFINQDKNALTLFHERLQQQNSNDFSVPAFFFCDSRWAGFAEAETSGKTLMHALNYCRKHIQQDGQLTPRTVNVLREWGAANQFNLNKNMIQSAAQFIPMAAFMDAITPCAVFSLAAFLAFLWLYPRYQSQLATGCIFIVSLVVIHWIRQVNAIYYYQVIPWMRGPAVIVGFLLLLYIVYFYRKLRFNDETRPARLHYVSVFLTAILVQIYQQTCALNVALIFEQWLSSQTLTMAGRLFYYLVYHLFYALPLVLFLAFYIFLSRSGRLASLYHKLSVAACLILLMIAGLLVIYPTLLASLSLSSMVLVISLLGGWIIVRLQQRYGR